jgi:teichuronic acid biosynthesis glycosyltransferase TuaG
MTEEKILEKRVGEAVNKAPQVSVVIPAYNVAEFINGTLDSVLAQTFKNYEIILVNDGSPDTAELERALGAYFKNIVYIKQKNAGAATARNTAIRAARGEWLAFLDGDDIWFPEYLAAQTEALRAKNCDLIYADAELFGETRDDAETFMQLSKSEGAVTTESLIEATCNVITSGTVVRRETVLKAGLFDEKLPRVGIGEDFELWFRLAKAGARLDYQRRVLLKYRVRPNSLSGSNVLRAERNITSLEIIREKNTLTASENRVLEEQLEIARAELEIETGKFNLTRGNFAEARRNFRRANEYHQKFKFKALLFLLAINPRLTLKLFRKMRPAEFSFIAQGEK